MKPNGRAILRDVDFAECFARWRRANGSDMIVTNDVLARFVYRPDMGGIS